jgi:FkbM family methyltransferase
VTDRTVALIGMADDMLWAGFSGDLAFDVGANMGQTVERMLGQFAHVVALEPATESFGPCRARWAGDERVTCRCVAIADHDGELTVEVRQAPILSGQVSAAGMPYHGEHLDEPGTASWGPVIATRTVPCVTLDTLAAELGHPDAVKVDTEGHEVQVLKGATGLLAGRGCKWIVEFHTAANRDECAAILEAAGYAVLTLRAPHLQEGSYMHRNYGWLKAVPA